MPLRRRPGRRRDLAPRVSGRLRASGILALSLLFVVPDAAIGAGPTPPTGDQDQPAKVAIAIEEALRAAEPRSATVAETADARPLVPKAPPGETSAAAPRPAPSAPAPSASPALTARPAPTPRIGVLPSPVQSAPLPTASEPGSGGSTGDSGGSKHPLPTPTPSPTPMPTITPPPRPALADGHVPAAVLSNLGALAWEMPAPYYDGCHVSMGGVISSKPCLYGNLSSHTTIAIYGDSHALAWFGGVLKTAQAHGWRVLNVTMSACIPAELTQVTRGGSVMTACTAFHKAAIAKLAKYHPTVILVTGTRGFRTIDAAGHLLTGTAKAAAWTSGMKRALAKLIPIAKRIALIADTPNSRFADTIGCTRTHPSSVLACATGVTHAVNYSWLNTEYHAALIKHVAFIDPERWVCRASPCPLVVGTSLLTHRNAGHMTLRFSKSMATRIGNAITAILVTPGTVIGP